MIALSNTQIEILNAITNWKILDLDSIYSLVKYEFNRKHFHKNVDKLISSNLVEARKVTDKKRLFYSKKGAICDTSDILHDLMVTKLCLKLNQSPAIHNISLEHTICRKTHNDPLPDAEFYYEGIDARFALELELTQKDEKRILNKMADYERMGGARVIYVFDNRTAYNKYVSVCRNILPKVGGDATLGMRFIFVMADSFYREDFDIFNSMTTSIYGELLLSELFLKLKNAK